MTEVRFRRQQLRSATAAEHARVDALFPGGFVDAASYHCYLLGMHRLCADVLGAWQRLPQVPAFGVDAGRRVELLMADLEHAAQPPLPPGPPLALDSELDMVGAEYVIQGSRHGAMLLIRQAATLGHGAGDGAAFLHWLTGRELATTWQALLAEIPGRVGSHGDESRLMAAAIRTFNAAAFAFERARHQVAR